MGADAIDPEGARLRGVAIRLIDIADQRPTTMPALARIKGIGPSKLARCGPEVLEITRSANIAPATLKTYAEAVRTLAGFLADRGMPSDVAVITREHVEAFITDQLTRWRPGPPSKEREQPSTGLPESVEGARGPTARGLERSPRVVR